MSAQTIEKLVSRVGQNMAFETALRGCVSFVYRFMLGSIAGLPVTALSVNAIAGFVVTALLEIPAGVFADVFGRVRSTRLGCVFQAAAAVSLLLAIIVQQSSEAWMWVLIIMEGVFDSVGNACLSGAREAIYQGGINNLVLDETSKSDLRKQIFAFGERYTVWAVSLVPPTVVTLVVVLQQQFGIGYAVIGGIAIGWLALARNFTTLAHELLVADTSSLKTVKEKWHDLMGNMRLLGANFLDGSTGQGKLWAVYLLTWFSTIMVSCYVPVALVRGIADKKSMSYAGVIIFTTILFCAGRSIRALIIKKVVALWGTDKVIIYGTVLQGVIGAAALFGFGALPNGVHIGVASLFMISFDITSGIMLRALTGEVLARCPAAAHATALSILSGAAFMTQGVYSIRLTVAGIGCPGLVEVAVLATLCGVIGTMIMRKKSPALPSKELGEAA